METVKRLVFSDDKNLSVVGDAMIRAMKTKGGVQTVSSVSDESYRHNVPATCLSVVGQRRFTGD